MKKVSQSKKERLKLIENQAKIDKYFDWFINECNDQYDELHWLIDMAINPTKNSSKYVSDALNQVYNHMNEK